MFPKVQYNFILPEFVPPYVYQKFGVRSISFLDKRLFSIAQFYRDLLDVPITVNDWYKGGNLDERGLRLIDSAAGAALSYHKTGEAFDCSWDFNKVPKEFLISEVKRRSIFLKKEFGIGKIFVYGWGIHTDVRPTNEIQINYI